MLRTPLRVALRSRFHYPTTASNNNNSSSSSSSSSRSRSNNIYWNCRFHDSSIKPRGGLALAAPTQRPQQHAVRFQTTAATRAQTPCPLPLVYQPPTSGLVSKLPSSWVPYAELARFDKPAGALYLFLPCALGTLLAAPMASPISTPLEVACTISLFLAGSFIMRGAGCTINDFWDRNLDPMVERTRSRPLARRAISPQAAIGYFGCQLLAGLGILLQFPTSCLYYGVPSVLLLSVYPLAKRVTSYPQFVLGLAFSWGSLIAFPAMSVDLLTNPAAAAACAALYASCVTWTLNYDMIYAFQDIKDDPKAGIKSIAQAHNHNAKLVLYGLSAVQTGLLGLAGYCAGAGPLFYLVSCGGGALSLANMVRRVKLDDPKDCWWWFRNGVYITGGTISLGLLADYMYRLQSQEAEAETDSQQPQPVLSE